MDDLISRQAAIEALQKEINKGIPPFDDVIGSLRCGVRLARNIIEDLPSAEPEIIRCKDCRWWDRDWVPAVGDGHYCPMIDHVTDRYFFCSYAEPEDQSCS